MTAALLDPFIIVAGARQALGNSMNARLRGALINPWPAATCSFIPIVLKFVALFLVMPTPLQTPETLASMPWCAPLGGVAGAVAVFGGLVLIDKLGAGPFNRLTIAANLFTSIAIDHFGWLGMKPCRAGIGRPIGVVLMGWGILLISLV